MKIRYVLLASLALAACIPEGEEATECLFDPVSNVEITAPSSSTTSPAVSTSTSGSVPTTTSVLPTTTSVGSTTTSSTTSSSTTSTTSTTVAPIPGLPASRPGSSTSKIEPLFRGESIERPSGDSTGNFRTFCGYSHFNYDDSIVLPGRPGASHLHVYFGNVNSNANSTADSIASSGNSTCQGGIANRSSYWVPALLDSKGNPVIPDGNMVYYKSGYQGVDPGRGKDRITLPLGLKLIAGNAKATAPQNVLSWKCSNDSFGFPTVTASGRTIPQCFKGQKLVAQLDFPQCWDGVNLDSADHKSHVVYGTYGVGCPSSHPVPLPEITYNVQWEVTDANTTGWSVSSDMGQPGGTTFHGDIVTGWNTEVRDTWLANCTRQNADCHVGIISDTQRLV